MLQILFMFIFVQVTMEIEHQDIQKTPSTIYFVEEMKPEYIEYIDACKIRAQTDSAYWQVLKESMSTGMIQLDSDNCDDGNDSNTNISANEDNMSTDDTSIKSLLEYQIKMLENLNYAVDMLTEKCDELTKYCAKLANRLKKYGVEHDNTVDVNGITSNNVMPESISLKRRVHTDNDSTTDSLESSNNVETVEV